MTALNEAAEDMAVTDAGKRPTTLTMRDVAERAGVSYTTVSYVLNDRSSPRGISDETRRRVLAAATEMGYRRNELARAVVTGRRTVLGFVTPDPREDAEFKARILAGVQEEANERGYLVKVLYVPGREIPPEVVERCVAWRLAGVVLVGVGADSAKILSRELTPHGITIGTVEDADAGGGVVAVTSDEEAGMTAAVEHLARLGHARIAHLAGAPADPFAVRRAERFRASLDAAASVAASERAASLFAAAAADPESVVWGEWWDIGAIRQAADALLDRPTGRRPTAIICCGDPAAMVTLGAARARGLRVPGDLSVVGYGDYGMAAYADPALTTVAQPFREMGRAAVREMLGPPQAEGPMLDVVLPTRLMIRASTAPPPA